MKPPTDRRLLAPRTLLLAAALAGLLPLGGGQALATHIGCGAVITQDTTLDSDLTDCPGTGLFIGADNITLDLNGHTIDGTGGDRGIDNGAGYDGVTIVNGTVQQFLDGIVLDTASSNRLSRLTVINNTLTGILLRFSSSDNSIDQNEASGNTDGILLFNSFDNRIRGNVASGNGNIGIGLSSFSNDNRMVGNAASGNASDGIFVDSNSNGTRLVANRTDQNADDGVDIDHPQTTISATSANNNGDWGIEAVAGVTGHGNRASGNNGGGTGGQCLNVSCS